MMQNMLAAQQTRADVNERRAELRWEAQQRATEQQREAAARAQVAAERASHLQNEMMAQMLQFMQQSQQKTESLLREVARNPYLRPPEGPRTFVDAKGVRQVVMTAPMANQPRPEAMLALQAVDEAADVRFGRFALADTAAVPDAPFVKQESASNRTQGQSDLQTDSPPAMGQKPPQASGGATKLSQTSGNMQKDPAPATDAMLKAMLPPVQSIRLDGDSARTADGLGAESVGNTGTGASATPPVQPTLTVPKTSILPDGTYNSKDVLTALSSTLGMINATSDLPKHITPPELTSTAPIGLRRFLKLYDQYATAHQEHYADIGIRAPRVRKIWQCLTQKLLRRVKGYVLTPEHRLDASHHAQHIEAWARRTGDYALDVGWIWGKLSLGYL
jgi:hypothetical protein